MPADRHLLDVAGEEGGGYHGDEDRIALPAGGGRALAEEHDAAAEELDEEVTNR